MSKPDQPTAVSVVEDHDEALVVIYRAIGSKKIPLNGSIFVHFDAHPDLLSPNLPADQFTDKEKLFAFTSIAEWILPAVYMGHIGCVVWVKPPWSSQIRDGEYELVVGREKTTGHLRVGTSLPYFISDQLYASTDNLTNIRTIPLHVLTLPLPSQTGHKLTGQQLAGHQLTGQQLIGHQLGSRQLAKEKLNDDVISDNTLIENKHQVFLDSAVGSLNQHDDQVLPVSKTGLKRVEGVVADKTVSSCVYKESEKVEMYPPLTKKSRSLSSSPPPPPPPLPRHHQLLSTAERVLRDILNSPTHHHPWLLDIDLDFFSTANPFKKEFSQDEYQFLEHLYKFQEPVSDSRENIAECVETREEQLDTLQDIWCASGEGEELAEWRWRSLTSHEQEWIAVIKTKIGTLYDGVPLEPEDVHLAGMMTDLPHHIATHSEMTGLLEAMHRLLQVTVSSPAGSPALVTIARSAEDGYTPEDHVDWLLGETVSVVKSLCGDNGIKVFHRYLDHTHPRTDSTN